tara:strand:+ start:733 stop:1170 length:438 start_codon:yes stop_codon:yes gene_type:complete
MNSFLFFKKYFLIVMIINLFSTSVFSEQRNCLSYPYPEGIFLKKKFMRQRQLIYTQTESIKSKNIEMIDFIKEKTDLNASSSLYRHIKLNFPNLKANDIGIYKIYSCFNNKGTYKISYGQRVGRLKGLDFLQKSRNFIKKKLKRD